MEKIKINKRIKKISLVMLFLCLLTPTSSVFAQYKIEQLGEYSGTRDFVVGPGKVDVLLDAGGSRTIDIYVSNRMGEDRMFELQVEDFIGSQSTNETVVLLGEERGPYSLRDYLIFEPKRFELKNNERATIPVQISVPLDVEPGGHYGTILVTTTSLGEERSASGATGGTAIVSRIGILFFVRVPGDVNERGEVTDFKIVGDKKFISGSPVDFQILYRNEGSVHLNPYGEISVKNIFGQEVGLVEIEPWFAMPSSLRLREVSWNPSFLFGKYTAELSVNRGYENIIDTEELTFYVIPWMLVAGVFVFFVIVITLIKVAMSKFEIRRK